MNLTLEWQSEHTLRFLTNVIVVTKEAFNSPNSIASFSPRRQRIRSSIYITQHKPCIKNIPDIFIFRDNLSNLVKIFRIYWCYLSPTTKACTCLLISIQLHPGIFFRPLSFISFRNFSMSSCLPAAAYMFERRT